jgi:hypothetical protein
LAKTAACGENARVISARQTTQSPSSRRSTKPPILTGCDSSANFLSSEENRHWSFSAPHQRYATHSCRRIDRASEEPVFSTSVSRLYRLRVTWTENPCYLGNLAGGQQHRLSGSRFP